MVFASSEVSNVSLAVPVSCNVNTIYDTSHTASIIAGTYRADIGTTTFRVFCNDGNGYSIYAIGYSNEEYGNTKLLATIGGVLAPNYDIVTGTATSGETSNWAMKMIPVTGTYAPTIPDGTNDSEDFINYHAVPTTYTKVATFDSSTDITIGSAVQSTYAAFIAGNQPAGTYSGKVKYTLVHPDSNTPKDGPQGCNANKICYYPADNSVLDTMADQTASPNTETILWASNFQRSGYGFAGWTDKWDWVLNENDANGNGTGPNAGYHIYGPMQTITTPTNLSTKGLSLYAVWVSSQGSFQDYTCPSDDVMPIGTVTALTDQRDNQTYAVTKLADSNCWMAENLRLDHQYTVGQNQNNPNVTNESLAQGYGGVFAGLAEPETNNFDNTSTANSLYTTNSTAPAPFKIITGSNLSYRFPRYNNQNTSNAATNMTSTGSNVYSYGNYYSWPAARANTGGTPGNSSTSICPKNWHLPYGGNGTSTGGGNTNGGFYYLGVKLGATTASSTTIKLWRAFPNNFIYSGGFYGASANNRGSRGEYWSHTAVNSYNTYTMAFISNNFYLTGANARYRGYTIKCVWKAQP